MTGLRRGLGLRWGLAGVAVCVISLSVNMGLYRAPAAGVADEPPRCTPPARAFIPPPARPDF